MNFDTLKALEELAVLVKETIVGAVRPVAKAVKDVAASVVELVARVDAVEGVVKSIEHGKDGVGIADVDMNDDGELLISLSSDPDVWHNVGKVRAVDGKDGDPGVEGNGIDRIDMDADGKLNILYTDGAVRTIADFRPADGNDGKDGASVAGAIVTGDGELIFHKDNGEEFTVEDLRLTKGIDGKDGLDGVGISDIVIVELGSADFVLSDGRVKTIPLPMAPAATPNGIKSVDYEAGILTVTLDDGGERKFEMPVAENGISIKGEPGNDGKDGVSLAGAMIGRDGELVVTLSNGEIKNLGAVVGRDGVDAKGEPGNDGKDGLGFDDIQVEHDGERGFSIKFVSGERVKAFDFSIPAMIYRGGYDQTKTYAVGDTVTHMGSLYHADEIVQGMPGVAKGWTLAARAGVDGKNGKSVRGAKGEPGAPGKDLTQIGPDGRKW